MNFKTTSTDDIIIFVKKKIRNIAIIAHVDHGKTTLVDAMLKQGGAFKENQETRERAMDSNEIEKERGITILAKCTSIVYQDTQINIVDTPGHSDFGSEVERILSICDGFILLVDAAEGVMPQTKFVLQKALSHQLSPILFINKIDRTGARPLEVMEEVMELIMSMDPEINILEIPVLYGSGREGYASSNLEEAEQKGNIYELMAKIIEYVPEPKISNHGLQFLVSMMDYDLHFGSLLIGKIQGGPLALNDNLISIDQDGIRLENFRLNKMFAYFGTKKYPIERAEAGEIVALVGAEHSTVNHTIVKNMETPPVKATKIDPPIFSVTFCCNTSPLVGKDGGTKLTSRHIGDRLKKEKRVNVGITLTEYGESFEICGRGELQLSIIMEQMRREGYEFSVKSPKILFQEVDGKILEPYEIVTIDVDTEFMGSVMENMASRGATTLETTPLENGKRMRLIFRAASRLMLGYCSKLLSDTKGTGIMNRQFDKYDIKDPKNQIRTNGLLIATEGGVATAYALDKLRDRGIFFIGPNTVVYPGMVIGEHNRSNNLEVNCVKMKQLTNMRTTSKDDAIKLPPHKIMHIEDSISYISGDEQIEITPKNVRICIIP